MSEREYMEFDVVVVGAGPAGLAAACRLMQLAEAEGTELNICVVEKGSEIGAHILSGAVFEPRALDELFPDWSDRGAPVKTAVDGDEFWFLRGAEKATRLAGWMVPRGMHNAGNYIISLGQLCRWLGEQAENMGINLFPGFAAAEVLYEDGRVVGVATGDMGRAADGKPKPTFEAGYELRARYTIFAEGCRGSLGKQLIEKYDGAVPEDRDALEGLPGVGRKTANVVMNMAFGHPTMAVDTHVFRIANRLGMAPGKTPEQVEEGLLKVVPPEYGLHAHHWLILHGRYVCVARKPKCFNCVIRELCIFKDKTAAPSKQRCGFFGGRKCT